jgi:hypothetical protein
MRFVWLLLFLILAPCAAYADDVVDLHVYATNLVTRLHAIRASATTAREENRIEFSNDLVIAAWQSYDHNVMKYDQVLGIYEDLDAKTKSGSFSNQDYVAFLQNAKPAFHNASQ